MAFSEKAFCIKNHQGQALYGIAHEPKNPNGGLVVMFNIGLHYRVGHSRLFIMQARHLQEAGFVVIRVDTARIGYSHGEMPTGRAIDSFDSVQTGLFKDDALLVIRHFRDTYKAKSLYLYGLCGGALTAIIAAALEKSVDGVVFIAGPVTVTSPDYELSTLHPYEAGALLSGYMRRLVSPRAWARFLTGKTSYKELFDSIRVRIGERLSSWKPERPSAAENEQPGETATPKENKGDLFNNVYLEAFDDMMKSGRPILFIMPENDRATYDFDKMFVKHVLVKYTEFEKYYKIVRIPQADHTFSLPETARSLFDTTRDWLCGQVGR
jgi:pimeloyl-ACP methyl ester carboxylesterase